MIRRCRDCNAGMVIKRLTGIQDDGELHTVRCWDCKGTGYLDERGQPVHMHAVRV